MSWFRKNTGPSSRVGIAVSANQVVDAQVENREETRHFPGLVLTEVMPCSRGFATKEGGGKIQHYGTPVGKKADLVIY